MLRSYQIVLGGECVSVRDAASAELALIEYLRLAGCRDEDIVRLGTRSVSWRGAVYKAVLVREPHTAHGTRKS